jgi:integrase/recombinase XerD
MLTFLSMTRHPKRNKLIFLLSVKAGLRAKEIANLTWRMTNDAQGDIGRAIHLHDSASTGNSGRVIPLSREVREALIEYRRTVPHAGPHAICTERLLATSPQAIVNMFSRWYAHLGFVGCSSHSARRTFITNAARKISRSAGRSRMSKNLPATRTSAPRSGTLIQIPRLRFGRSVCSSRVSAQQRSFKLQLAQSFLLATSTLCARTSW